LAPLPVAKIQKMKKATTLIITLILCVQSLFAQKIQGIVFDQETKAPLWGASVSIKGSPKGNVTDAKGQFRISASTSEVLLVSFVGYEPAEIAATQASQIPLKKSNFLQDEVVVRATRADENSAMAYSNVSAAELGKSNLGLDMPQLLNFTPSIVTTSDAGAGVGYTGIRIRGSDATRVNVTVNGIPINDSESQGTFWVNMPDFASSVNSVQIQRGVGTSTNGAGAFGGSVNMQTNSYEPKAYGEVHASGGSFGTLKTTVKAGSGLLGGKFTVDGRLSRIVSDGFIDRASSNLVSAYFSGGYFGAKSFARFNYFTGNEKTYQSWYGTPESRISGSTSAMQDYIDRNYLTASEADNLLKSGRTYNYYTYDNQTDNYAQDHFQLITNHRLSEAWNLDLNAHYTYGRGYFEEFKPSADLNTYGIANSLRSVDVIRRKWLDNDFYGSTFALNYVGSQIFKFTFGGAWNRYVGRHFGVLQDPFPGREWYRSRSQKTDLNLYAKGNINFSAVWNAYVDVQFRTVGYRMLGTADKFLPLDSDNTYSFFNPKFGLTHQISEKSKVYGSVSAGSKEPSRQDFVDNPGAAPRPEYLQDYELGYEQSGIKYAFQLNGYFMNYQDQLVLTGAVNSTGDAIRKNVDASYRLGVEVSLNYQISKRLLWNGNVTLSQNRIQHFKEEIIDYDTYDQAIIHHENTDIAYSPAVIAGNTLTYAVGSFEASLLSKYVGKQFLDNTANEARSIKAYTTQDIRLKYTMKKGPAFTLLLNNVLNEMYSSNGYTYSYRYAGATTTENFYYPQAGFNFLLGASLRF
jgi:iron complex outermembrane receptor protein